VNLPHALSPRGLAGLVLPAALGACAHAAPAPTPPPTDPAPSAAATATPIADPYHPPPRDTVDAALYKAWQQYSLQCARCHGEDGQGTSFGPSLVVALKPDGDIPTREKFLDVLVHGRHDKGMPSAEKMGLDSVYFEGLYDYLKGRSDGHYQGGRPARRDG
jgi:mono/diheme cytochrome c family protein